MNAEKKIKINKKINAPIVGVYIYLILFGLPIFLNNGFFDLPKAKFYYYFVTTIVLLIVILLNLLINKIFSIDFKNINLNKTDISILVFTLISSISFLFSKNMSNTFFGDPTRYDGFILIILLCISYFIITKYAFFKTNYINAFIISSLIVAILGILHYLGIDILGLKKYLFEKQKNIFISTIGNLNSYTAFVSFSICISFILFCKVTEKKLRIFYFVSVAIGYISIITGVSDNAYISLGALFLFSPFYLFATLKGLKGYLTLILIFFISIKSIKIINMIFLDKFVKLDGIFNFLASNNIINILIILLFFVVLFIYYIDFKKDLTKININKKFIYIWGIFLIVMFIVVVFLFYLFNFTDFTINNPLIKKYFIFNDSWGTLRGYIWRYSFQFYKDFSLKSKLIGIGPSNFISLVTEEIFNEMVAKYKFAFDNPHNIFINYLLTTGILGLISYLSFIINAFIKLLKQAKTNIYSVAIFFALLSYYFQSMINFETPIVTPIAMVLLSVGLASCSD